MKAKDFLFSWDELEYGEDKTMFIYCKFTEQFGPWQKNEFVECLVLDHSTGFIEEWDVECNVVRRKQILLEVA